MKRLLLISLFISSTCLAEPCRLTILHFNDFHGHVENAAKMAHAIKAVRTDNARKGRDTLLLNGGDLISGTPVSAKFSGEAEFSFVKMIGADASVPGNHDFDFGMIPLIENIKMSGIKVVSANIYRKKNHKRIYPAYTIVGSACGDVAILGLAHPATPFLTKRTNVSLFLFEDGKITAKKVLPELLDKSDIQIALTHQGVGNDVKLAAAFKEIDAVIGGHDHVSPDRYCQNVDKTPVCQTPANGEYLGLVDLVIDDGRVVETSQKLISIKDEKADPAVQKKMRSYLKMVEKEMSVVIGISSKKYSNSRLAQSELGTLITKIFKEYTGADIGLLNSGGIRQNLEKGKITVGEIEEILPFPNNIVVINLSGRDIQELLDPAEKNSKALQFYGIDVKELSPNRLYTVATSDFLTSGGSGYKSLSQARIVKNTEKQAKQIVIEYIKKEKKI